ncbi:MAG: 1-acyl-sn-glycerol-3-phosphate acyltransferase, partial [Gammaproteobacteria bacterium]|nr:1-acyl-sn-glycerol-3-phosphate acyltransferase [Gammaproteobacteria bacterium]
MDEWEYHPPPDIDESMSEHLQNFPRQPYMLVYAIRSIAALLLRGWMRIYHRMRIDGRDHLPASGSYILVCNHTSHLDTLCMLCSVPLKQ